MPEFAVWAPLPKQVRLDVDGQLHDMTVDDDGWWRADVDAGPDARYGFVLDDDPTVLPDPRSARQPTVCTSALNSGIPPARSGRIRSGRAGPSRVG